MERVGPFRPPVELVAPPRETRFLAGVAAGVVLAIVAAQLWMAQHLEPLVSRRHETRSLSSLALGDEWRWGVPAACGLALAVMLVRVRRPLPYLLLAALALALLAATYLWAMAPFEELATGPE